MRRFPVTRRHRRTHRPNPCSRYRARAPVGNTPFDVCHADPPRVVAAGRAFTTKFRRRLTSSCRLWAPSDRYHPSRACRTCRSHEHARLTPPAFRPTTHPANACAFVRCSDSAAFRRRHRRRPTGQSRSYVTPVKGWRSLDPGRLPPYRLTACFRLRSGAPCIRS